jgi:hypothetical protein
LKTREPISSLEKPRARQISLHFRFDSKRSAFARSMRTFDTYLERDIHSRRTNPFLSDSAGDPSNFARSEIVLIRDSSSSTTFFTIRESIGTGYPRIKVNAGNRHEHLSVLIYIRYATIVEVRQRSTYAGCLVIHKTKRVTAVPQGTYDLNASRVFGSTCIRGG